MDARSRLGERIGRKHEIGLRKEETYPLPYMIRLAFHWLPKRSC